MRYGDFSKFLYLVLAIVAFLVGVSGGAVARKGGVSHEDLGDAGYEPAHSDYFTKTNSLRKDRKTHETEKMV